jgi:DNA-binding response OmpR family regulator
MEGKKIVTIDDCKLTLAVARDMLEAAGFEVATASATIEANPLVFCSNPPDLILVDVEMPLLNGKQTVGFLKSRESSKNIAVLMTSAKTREELSVIAKEAGADGFVCKPLLPQVLLPQVRALIAYE